MGQATVIGISGSTSGTSKSRRLLEGIVARIADRSGAATTIVDIGEIAADLGRARQRSEASERLESLLRAVEQADVIIAASPVYKGSYTGLFKHFVDLIGYRALAGRPVGLLATGGSERHALVVEHQLRPLFAFFVAHTLPTGVFVSDRELADGTIADPALQARITALVNEAAEAIRTVRAAA